MSLSIIGSRRLDCILSGRFGLLKVLALVHFGLVCLRSVASVGHPSRFNYARWWNHLIEVRIDHLLLISHSFARVREGHGEVSDIAVGSSIANLDGLGVAISRDLGEARGGLLLGFAASAALAVVFGFV